MTELAWNPRYANYARAHKRSPEEQTAEDRRAWPGGSMCGFLLWNRARLAEAHKAIPNAFIVGGRLVDHDAYDSWLSARVDEMISGKPL